MSNIDMAHPDLEALADAVNALANEPQAVDAAIELIACADGIDLAQALELVRSAEAKTSSSSKGSRLRSDALRRQR